MYERTATLSLRGCGQTWLYEKLMEQRKTGHLCDFRTVVHGVTYPVHRAVLSAYSQYFEKMFHGHFQVRCIWDFIPVVVFNRDI